MPCQQVPNLSDRLLGHVPFGHTLEDEFTGIYKRHDSLAGSRVCEMLFNEASELASVFSDDHPDPWLPGLSNSDLQRSST